MYVKEERTISYFRRKNARSSNQDGFKSSRGLLKGFEAAPLPDDGLLLDFQKIRGGSTRDGSSMLSAPSNLLLCPPAAAQEKSGRPAANTHQLATDRL